MEIYDFHGDRAEEPEPRQLHADALGGTTSSAAESSRLSLTVVTVSKRLADEKIPAPVDEELARCGRRTPGCCAC